MSQREHEPFIFLSSRVASAGADMIERIGEIKTHMALGSSPSMMAYPWEQLRQAIGEAAAALVSYDRVIATGRERLTSEEFHRAHDQMQAEPV
jgi:hypothetical protein